MKINITPDVLIGAIGKVVSKGKVGWPGEDHRAVTNKTIDGFTTTDGQPVEIGEEVKDIVRLACCPTPDLKMRMIKGALANAGYEMEEDAEQALLLLTDMSAFGTFLANSDNPETGKPFIEKQKKNKKRKSFQSLLKSSAAKPNTPAEQIQPGSKKSGAVKAKGTEAEETAD